eukprot:CAMPEP_0179466368 /NCGR_PEP_ID=MMETSP0799-20121207/47687_1 /TAXON_ID=46947 /ORGANISM="Geminigera cryophila, Strain CCMP2564" /LENGTH=108 /DNA_ID=CAMNT_0021271087 /DNA_START=504 /DNA_END=831 /DNA_ORIENTATION=-
MTTHRRLLARMVSVRLFLALHTRENRTPYEVLPRFKRNRKTKIDDFHVFVGVNQQIIEFDISVHDAGIVAVLQPSHDLDQQSARLCLPEAAMFAHIATQVAAAAKLHN